MTTAVGGRGRREMRAMGEVVRLMGAKEAWEEMGEREGDIYNFFLVVMV